MLRLIAILTGSCLALAVSVHAAEHVDKAAGKKPAQRSKPVQKQQFSPSQHTASNTHVQTLHAQHTNNPVHNRVNSSVHRNVNSTVSKKQFRIVPAVQSNNLPAAQSNKINRQTVKNVQSQHLNFHAKPNPAITSAKFSQNYQIAAAQNWTGPQYNAFRSYQSQWQDQGWYRSHYNNLSLIGGGWYFWDAGYWYPAWGYDEAAAYYPYDGPIYSGPRARPLDQVVADVQSTLQEQGYYHGEVDGLVGPQTQEALVAYQSAQGLQPTAAIDQPTLDSLGLG